MNFLDLINRIQQSALNYFSHAIFPVYAFTPGEPPIHIGTCFAFEYKGRQFLVTAAHVLDEKQRAQLAFGSTNTSEPVLIQGTFYVVDPGSKPRTDDPLDFAWHELSAEEAKSVPCIPEAAIEDSMGPEQGQRLYTIIGFPASKNKKVKPADLRARRLSPKRAQYTNLEAPAAAYFALRGMAADTHLAMRREQRSHEADGSEVNTIGHHGFSGGPLIFTGHTTSPIAEFPQRVAGIVLEGDDDYGLIAAVRLSVILRHIDKIDGKV